jgi:hypothetical protein
MASLRAIRTVTAIGLAVAGLQTAEAMDQMTARWSGLCEDTRGRELHIATRSGKTLKGMCNSTGESEMTLRRGGKLVTIDRTEISQIRMLWPVDHRRLRALSDDASLAILGAVFVVGEPFGFVVVPVFLAWEAVALPVCALHDLAHKVFRPARSVEIKLV